MTFFKICKRMIRKSDLQKCYQDLKNKLPGENSNFRKSSWEQQFVKSVQNNKMNLCGLEICKFCTESIWKDNLQNLQNIVLNNNLRESYPKWKFANKLIKTKWEGGWEGREGVKHFSIQSYRVRNFWPLKAPDLHILLRDSDSVFLFVCVKLKFLNLPVLEIIIYNISFVICNIEAMDESCLPHQSPAGWERRRSPRWPCPGQPRGSYKSRKHGELFTSVRSSPSIVVRELRGNPPNTKWL